MDWAKQLQDEMRIIYILEIGAAYIRDFMVYPDDIMTWTHFHFTDPFPWETTVISVFPAQMASNAEFDGALLSLWKRSGLLPSEWVSTQMWHSLLTCNHKPPIWRARNSVWCPYNLVNFLKNSHNRLLWVWSLVNIFCCYRLRAVCNTTINWTCYNGTRLYGGKTVE